MTAIQQIFECRDSGMDHVDFQADEEDKKLPAGLGSFGRRRREVLCEPALRDLAGGALRAAERGVGGRAAHHPRGGRDRFPHGGPPLVS